MITTPLGSLARSRKDWTIEQLRYGQIHTNGADDNLSDVYSLNNNAGDGSPIALWGVLAFYSVNRPTMVLSLQPALQGTPSNDDFQLMGNSAATAGYTSFFHNTVSWTAGQGILFIADGRHWLTNGESPLFIIPVGSAAVVLTYTSLGLNPPGAESAVTFLWGPYSTARLKRS